MSSLTTLEKRKFEKLFGMQSGYVLDFNNRSFADFFDEVAEIDIEAEKYQFNGTSKAKRLRAFWKVEEDDITVGKVLGAMLELWKDDCCHKNPNYSFEENETYQHCKKVVARLLAKKEETMSAIMDFFQEDFQILSRQKAKIINPTTAFLGKIKIKSEILPIIRNHYKDACSNLEKDNSPLSIIILCGAMLESILLGVALENNTAFENASCAAKGPLERWTLEKLIESAHELEYLREDTYRVCHDLRNLRNYVHPGKQIISKFNPDQYTAEICTLALRTAIADLAGEREAFPVQAENQI